MRRTEWLAWPGTKVAKLGSKAIRKHHGDVSSHCKSGIRLLVVGSKEKGNLYWATRVWTEGFTAWSKQGCTVINAVIAEKKSNKCTNCSRTSKPLAEASSLCLTFSLVRFLFFRFCIRKVNFYRTSVHMRMSVTSALAWCLAVSKYKSNNK